MILCCLSIIKLGGCTNKSTQEPKTQAAQIESKVNQIIIHSWSQESIVTPLLKQLATQYNAQLLGLEHRLKTYSSTKRKIKKIMHDHPKRSLDNIQISDGLRFTFKIEDEPKGHYVSTINKILKSLEGKGYSIVKVKNYWPKGDNYSGVNSVLKTESGLEWEVQFHTQASFDEAKRSRSLYERLRSTKTPLKEKQTIFKEMAQPWNTINVPTDVLKEHNLHSTEKIIQHKSP